MNRLFFCLLLIAFTTADPVMTGAKNLYVVYYGSFTTTQHTILDTFLQNLGGSPAFNVNSGYYNAQNVFVENVLNYSPATDSYDDKLLLGKEAIGQLPRMVGVWPDR